MIDGHRIDLTPAEKRLALWLGQARQEINERKGRRHHFVTDAAKQVAYHQNGLAGELAVGRLLNCYPCLSLEIDHSHYDLNYHRQLIDVKTHSHLDGDLLIPVDEKNREPCDIYVGAFCCWMGDKKQDPVVWVKGWIHYGPAWEPHLLDEALPYPAQRIHRDTLRPMMDLTEIGLREDYASRVRMPDGRPSP